MSLALGALCMIMIAYTTGARWFVAIRRVAESVAVTLPALALGVIPVLVGMHRLYPWAQPGARLAPPIRQALVPKQGWLDPTFFVWRSLFYLAVWGVLASLLWRWSIRSDAAASERTERLPSPAFPIKVSALGLILFAFTVTFATFDWIMSMSPDWYSTIFGIYYFAGGMLAALSLLVLLTRAGQESGVLHDVVADSHYYALGRLLLTFVIFWGYIAYSQGYLVWIADIPGEARWYLARWNGGWRWLMVSLAIGQFLVPFLLLVHYAIKRHPHALAWVAGWLLLIHWMDLYWLVGPSPAGSLGATGWDHASALAGVLGFATAYGAWRLQGRLPTPRGDPAFPASLRYDSQ